MRNKSPYFSLDIFVFKLFNCLMASLFFRFYFRTSYWEQQNGTDLRTVCEAKSHDLQLSARLKKMFWTLLTHSNSAKWLLSVWLLMCLLCPFSGSISHAYHFLKSQRHLLHSTEAGDYNVQHYAGKVSVENNVYGLWCLWSFWFEPFSQRNTIHVLQEQSNWQHLSVRMDCRV